MSSRVVLIAILIFILPAISADGRRRTSETVKKERRDALRKVERTRGEIKSNLGQIRKELAEFESIEAEIRVADLQIKSLQMHTDSIATRVNILADSVSSTEARVAALKKSYISALRALRRQRRQASPVAYVVASKSFTEARKRMRYLGELSGRQKEKSVKLTEAAQLLKSRHATLDSVRTVLAADLSELRAKKQKLEKDRVTADNLVSRLRRNGKRLEQVLNDQQEKVRKLDRELERIIEAEARAAAEAERKRKAAEEDARRKAQTDTTKKSSAASGKKTVQTPRKTVTTPAASTFENAKGKLPMPVSGPALIVGDFGRHRHKDFEKVELMNNGIDIETNEGASAVAVYPGTVSMVIVMDGYHNVVLIRHGEYLTVYAGIANLTVRKGQEVKAGEALGTIYSDPLDNGRTRLHFEVRHEKEKLNPGEWLR